MNSETTLQRNLLALSGKNPNTALKIARSEISKHCGVRDSRSGPRVPAVTVNGTERALHSRFDPVREGERIAAANNTSGYLVVFGLGAAYHIYPLLKNKSISFILIIEKDASAVKALFTCFDYRSLFISPNVNLFVDESPETIKNFILSSYYPAISGNLQSIHLRPRFDIDKDYFMSVLSAIEHCIGELSDDYTVQAHFGKKWFLNTVANLPAAETSATVLRPVKKAVVIGAGPSLEIQIDKIAELKRTGSCLIATDTSLPGLLSLGLKPDIVISIDCQHITYHHFLAGYPREIPLVLDLASPRGITRLTDKLVFFTSGHPFSLYVNSHWRQFPLIDISGGNVSHAAVSLALTLGAKQIFLAGIDFSYPDGKSYARGTYLYTYFQQFSSLLSPLESQFFTFLLRNARIAKEYIHDKIRYTTKPMISYKQRLENAFSNSSAQFVPLQGDGVPLSVPSMTSKKRGGLSHMFSAGRSLKSWREFLTDYLEGLESLRVPADVPLPVYLSDLEPHQRDLWVTLFPAAAVFQRNEGEQFFDGKDILSRVQSWSTTLIQQFLENYSGISDKRLTGMY
jgi:hypothetical protein